MYVATNLTDFHKEESFLSELLTQVTNGTKLTVLEEREKWCRVRQEDGYEGWAYTAYLTETPPAPATHLLGITCTLYAEPNELADSLSSLLIGTSVSVVEKEEDGWSRVQPAGKMIPVGWVDSNFLYALDTLPLEGDDAREQIVSIVELLKGTYYLWGGCTDWGTDCSGLAQLAHRLAGYSIPRDARLQYPVGRVVEPPFEEGDLLFFHGEADKAKITHVGISTGGWNMLHSSRSRNGVYEEDVQANENLRKTFAGARSFLPE